MDAKPGSRESKQVEGTLSAGLHERLIANALTDTRLVMTGRLSGSRLGNCNGGAERKRRNCYPLLSSTNGNHPITAPLRLSSP